MARRQDNTNTRPIWPPEPGYFRLRLVPGGWAVAARITHEDGLWQVIIDGEPSVPHADPLIAGVDRVWHSADRSDATEYAWLLATKAHALAHAPDHPAANPRKPIRPALLRPIIPQQRTPFR